MARRARESGVAARIRVSAVLNLAIARGCLLAPATTACGVLLVGLLARPVAAQYDPPKDASRDTAGGIASAPFEGARRVTVGVSVAHDSNFFRDPGLVVDPQAETIVTGYAGLLIDKEYAQQRFLLSATATAYRHDKFKEFDFNGFDYRAAWYWRLTPRIGGTLSAARTEAPTQFQDTLSRVSDVTTNEDYVFDLNARVHGGWHILLGLSQSNRTSEQASLQGAPDYRESRGEAGIRYLFRGGSSIDGLWRRIEGDQDSQLIDNVLVVSSATYREDQSEVRATWNLGAKSVLTGRLTYLDRRYHQTPASDFSGTAGELGYNWLPTGKLALRVAARRDIEAWQSIGSNYRVSNTLSFAPTWRPTAKTDVYMRLERRFDEYPATSTAVPERKDTADIAVLGVRWLAARHLSIDANVHYEQRSSDNRLVEYDATIGRISASLIF